MEGKSERKKKKKPCLNLKIKTLMRFLFQKHILLIKSRESYRLVGGPAEPAAVRGVGAAASAKAPQGTRAQPWVCQEHPGPLRGSRSPRGELRLGVKCCRSSAA